jgi:predicted DCC family thiol-disulfide oxidoreductase YuxK
MKNGWTGGQYSIVRAILGAYLFVHFLVSLPHAHDVLSLFPNILSIAPLATPLVLLAAIASIFFAIGLYDRVAAVVIWYVLVCLFGRNPLIANPSLLFASLILLAHAFVPPAPFGSWSARGRTDPRGNWTMPPGLFAAMWIVMSLGYTFNGWTKLVSPSWVDGTARLPANPLMWGALGLELLYAPLALFRRMRPWIWTAMLAMHLGLMLLNGFADLSFMMVVLHLFTFDPSWVRARTPDATDVLLYDGSCGLCHRSVRLILAEDRRGTAFRFAPLPEDEAKSSAIVKTADGRTLTRSDAVIHILHRLGGLWRVSAMVSGVVPGVVRNTMYDGVARIRYRIFGRTKNACPLMPQDLRSRFNA